MQAFVQVLVRCFFEKGCQWFEAERLGGHLTAVWGTNWRELCLASQVTILIPKCLVLVRFAVRERGLTGETTATSREQRAA